MENLTHPVVQVGSNAVSGNDLMGKSFKIVSYNVNGLRARLKHGHLQAFLREHADIDFLCLQETKAEEAQVKLPAEIISKFPYRYWRSTRGTTQRKGLSGTAIWSRIPAIREIEPFDEEGRIVALEFPDFNLASVYTPTTGSSKDRYIYRLGFWHTNFLKFLDTMRTVGSGRAIVCGDLNVCHLDHDVFDPIGMYNRIPGFLNVERAQFAQCVSSGYHDVFRAMHPDQKGAFTWWNPRDKTMFARNQGLRLDYFLVCDRSSETEWLLIEECARLPDVKGSDHCPITMTCAL